MIVRGHDDSERTLASTCESGEKSRSTALQALVLLELTGVYQSNMYLGSRAAQALVPTASWSR